MLILALESSAKPASVAVYSEGKLLGQYFQNSGFSHSHTLLAMAESLLKNLGLKPNDIDLIAVARGPGSFTGIRIGVSAAKGIAWGLDVPVCGVSTLDAMTYGQGNGTTGLICPVMDAKRDQVYNALFEWRDDKSVRLTDDRAISLEDLATELKGYDRPCLLIGDGADISFSYLLSADVTNLSIAPELSRYQTAYGVALAAMNAESIPAVDLEPFYLRPSQAERVRGGGD